MTQTAWDITLGILGAAGIIIVSVAAVIALYYATMAVWLGATDLLDFVRKGRK